MNSTASSTNSCARFEISPSVRLLLASAFFLSLSSLACSQSDIRGSYRVEILIEDARSPIEATLVLSSTFLDVESLPYELRNGIAEGSASSGDGRDPLQEDRADPNSCLILPSTDPSSDAPRSVTFFEARFQAGDPVVPFSIYDAGDQRMEVTKLDFFANAIGGEIVFHEPEGDRTGRLVGDRLGEAQGTQCIVAMEKFYARILEIAGSE